MSPDALAGFLTEFAEADAGGCRHKRSGKRISACLPVHGLGHPGDIESIVSIAANYGVPVVEDAAEALGSTRRNRHCGTFGKLGVLSFNGNKIITTGGGGMILTDDEQLANLAKHLTTTAKQAHPWRFSHDQVGYNYRLPNINAALGLAQLEQLPRLLAEKRKIALRYIEWAEKSGVDIIKEPEGARSNYWLNALLLSNREEREQFLAKTNAQGVMTRPLWELLCNLPMYGHCQRGDLQNSKSLADRLVNIPSGVPA
jgi:perosamine synthetase